VRSGLHQTQPQTAYAAERVTCRVGLCSAHDTVRLIPATRDRTADQPYSLRTRRNFLVTGNSLSRFTSDRER
jgi:hypothetical protein